MHAEYRVLGGEDVSHRTELAFLQSSGYEVENYAVSNSEFAKKGLIRTFADMTFNTSIYRDVGRVMDSFAPEVIYVNNTFPALSPSAILAAKSRKIPVVQVLRNYRMGCIAGTTFRDGHDCQICVGQTVPLSGIRHACYRNSKAASTATTVAKIIQRSAGLADAADVYVAVSEHVRSVAIASGFDASSVVVRPNLVWPDPMDSMKAEASDRISVVFVGRDSHEKGLHVLLGAASQVPDPALRIDVIGCLRPSGFTDERVVFHGTLAPEEIAPVMSKALAVVVPSIWPEPFGRVVIEALSCGSQVIASRVGGMADFLGPGVTLVRPNDPMELAHAIRSLLDINMSERLERSQQARQYYEREFAPRRWLETTQEIFDAASSKR